MVTTDLVRVDKRQIAIPLDTATAGGEVIRVFNLVNQIVTFKMKTTNPARYVVRPNVSFIPVGKFVDIKLSLAQKAATPSPTVGPCKDRFQLRVARTPNIYDEASAIKFWNVYNDPSSMRIKFKVEFVQALAEPSSPTNEFHDASPAGTTSICASFNDKIEMLRKRLNRLESEVKNVRLQLNDTIKEKDTMLSDAPLINGNMQSACALCQVQCEPPSWDNSL